MSSTKLNIIKKKIDIVADMITTEEFKKADALMKRIAKMKEEVKEYCQHEEIRTIETEKNKVEFKTRIYRRLAQDLLPEEIREECTVSTETWLAYYEKK